MAKAKDETVKKRKSPVEQAIMAMVRHHGREAQSEAERDETIRLRARQRVAEQLFPAVMQEVGHANGHVLQNGGKRAMKARVAKACIQHAKEILRDLGIEKHRPKKS